mgnify:CR=1 FL=1
MELKNQVCSLELAKRLKELKAKQDSLFYWKFSNGMLEKVSNIALDTELVYGQQPQKLKTLGTWETCSAFTVAELGEMLPKEIKADKEYFIKQSFTILGLSIIKYTDTDGYDFISWSSITEADARAKTLIYLLENKLIEIQ